MFAGRVCGCSNPDEQAAASSPEGHEIGIHSWIHEAETRCCPMRAEKDLMDAPFRPRWLEKGTTKVPGPVGRAPRDRAFLGFLAAYGSAHHKGSRPAHTIPSPDGPMSDCYELLLERREADRRSSEFPVGIGSRGPTRSLFS